MAPRLPVSSPADNKQRLLRRSTAWFTQQTLPLHICWPLFSSAGGDNATARLDASSLHLSTNSTYSTDVHGTHTRHALATHTALALLHALFYLFHLTSLRDISVSYTFSYLHGDAPDVTHHTWPPPPPPPHHCTHTCPPTHTFLTTPTPHHTPLPTAHTTTTPCPAHTHHTPHPIPPTTHTHTFLYLPASFTGCGVPRDSTATYSYKPVDTTVLRINRRTRTLTHHPTRTALRSTLRT